MNCTDFDKSLVDIQSFVVQNDAGFVLASCLLLLTSATLLSHGEHLVRPLGAVIGGVGGSVSTYILSNVLEWECTVRLVVAVLSGIFTALLVLCLFKPGLVLLGAAGFGTVAHFFYDSLPLDTIQPPFILMGRSGVYYIVIVVAGILGGIVAYVQKKNLVRISSSLLGGGGLAVATHLIVDRTGASAPPVVLLVVLLVSALIGVLLQRQLSKHRQQKKREQNASG